jgi:hypothetical protein
MSHYIGVLVLVCLWVDRIRQNVRNRDVLTETEVSHQHVEKMWGYSIKMMPTEASHAILLGLLCYKMGE